jgi:hypothetical protein
VACCCHTGRTTAPNPTRSLAKCSTCLGFPSSVRRTVNIWRRTRNAIFLGCRILSAPALNTRTVPGAIDDPGLPRNMLDLILLVDIYHEFSEPEMLDHIESLAHPGSESA